MKAILKTTTLSVCAALLLLGSGHAGNAAIITGFETVEGFNAGNRNVNSGSLAAAWDLKSSTSAGRTSVSTARAKSGALSLAMLGGSAAEHVIQTLDKDGPATNSFSYSFMVPDGVYSTASVTTTSWIYLNLWNATTQASAGSVQLKTLFGRSDGLTQLQYSKWDAQGSHSYGSMNIPLSVDFNVWNTITLSLDYTGKTYTVALNGAAILSNAPLGPTQQTATTIGGSWLVSGNAFTSTSGVYATTFYDDITVIPEPSGVTTAASGVLLLGGWFFLKRLKSRSSVAIR